MDFLKLVKARRSVRKFAGKELPEGAVDKLLEAARWAPSAGNRQPWKFYVVKNADHKADLVEAAYGQEFLAEAPVVFVVCADPERSAVRYQKRGRNLYCLQDTAAAVQNILLAAREMRLGTCWMGAFDEEHCARILSLPAGLRPVAIIPVGYPDSEPEAPQRRPLADITEYLL